MVKIHEIIEKIKQKPKNIVAHIIATITSIIIIASTTTLMIYMKLIQTIDQAAAYITFAAAVIIIHILVYTEIMKRIEK